MKFSNATVAGLMSNTMLFLTLGGVAGDRAFRVDYLPVGSVRTDAIINQECVSDHVHTFYGPALLRPEVTYNDLISSDISINSGNVVENK